MKVYIFKNIFPREAFRYANNQDPGCKMETKDLIKHEYREEIVRFCTRKPFD